MIVRWLAEKIAGAAPEGETGLLEAVRGNMPGKDGESVRIVAALTGLLGSIAYADRDYAAVEEERIRVELARVEGLTAAGVQAILKVLREHIVSISTVEAPIYARELLDLVDRDFRFQVLEALVDLAAADDEITVQETNVLRLTATALGLTQHDYNTCQSRYRDKLNVLRVRTV